MVLMPYDKKRLEERRKSRKCKLVQAKSDDPIYSQGWQVGAAPVFRESANSPPDDSDQEKQPHPGLVPPIDPNAREERELKNPDGSDIQEFMDHYSPVLARLERRERGEE